MQSNKLFSVSVLILLLAGLGQAYAPFLENNMGVRPITLGGAYSGLADDTNAIYTNPAGLAGLSRWQLSSFYYTGDISFLSAGGAWPNMFGGTLAFGYRNRSLPGVILATAETVTATDQDFLIGYARSLRPNIFVGGNLRYVSTGYGSVYGSSLALGAGLKVSPRPGLGLGADIKNLIGTFTFRDGSTQKLPMIVTAGVSLKVLGENGLAQTNQVQSLLFNLDLSKSSIIYQTLLHFGVEWQPVSLLALRFGVDQQPNGADNYNNQTFGVGLKYAGVIFDYGQYRRADQAQGVTQYFSLGYVPPEKKIAPAVKSAVPAVSPEAVVVKKIKRVTFSDVPKTFWAAEKIERLATAGLIGGYPDGAFRPNQKVSRGEFEKMRSAAAHLTPVEVPQPDKLITRAEAASILRISGKLVRPDEPLTRAEAAVFISMTPSAEAAIKRLPPLEE